MLERYSTHLDNEHTPYWGFNDLFHKAGTKLLNCFYTIADEKNEYGKHFVKYETIMMLSNIKIENLIASIKNRNIYIDFDARTGHNHGTKFRIKPAAFPDLFQDVKIF